MGCSHAYCEFGVNVNLGEKTVGFGVILREIASIKENSRFGTEVKCDLVKCHNLSGCEFSVNVNFLFIPIKYQLGVVTDLRI